ncbi:MAG: putative PEP-binding protein, partial [Candidatus Cloacimonadia bacterium]
DLAKTSDFFSIGTNDLVQYTLAADRNNETLSKGYNYFNPAVLNLIRMTIESGKQNGRAVSLCGEMAGDPLAVPLLLGMGLEILSATADNILPVKKGILNSDLKKLQKDYQSVKNKSQKQIKQFYTKLLEEMNLKEEGVL